MTEQEAGCPGTGVGLVRGVAVIAYDPGFGQARAATGKTAGAARPAGGPRSGSGIVPIPRVGYHAWSGRPPRWRTRRGVRCGRYRGQGGG